MQDVLTADHRDTRELVYVFNVQMQAFMVVRNKNIFIDFIIFSDIYVC
jgi:hypothetical protein